MDFHSRHPGITERIIGQARAPDGRTTYELLLRGLPPAVDGAILDLACGSGPLIELLLPLLTGSARVLGVDIAMPELLFAKQRLRSAQVSLVQASADRLPLRSGSVSLVLCHIALNLFRPLDAVCNEIARVLSPGAVFAAIVGGIGSPSDLYDDFSALLQDVLADEFPSLSPNFLWDPRATTVEGISSAFEGVLDRQEATPVTVVLTGRSRSLGQLVARYFYPYYLLSDRGRHLVTSGAIRIFDRRLDEHGRVSFPIPHVKFVFAKA